MYALEHEKIFLIMYMGDTKALDMCESKLKALVLRVILVKLAAAFFTISSLMKYRTPACI